MASVCVLVTVVVDKLPARGALLDEPDAEVGVAMEEEVELEPATGEPSVLLVPEAEEDWLADELPLLGDADSEEDADATLVTVTTDVETVSLFAELCCAVDVRDEP